MSPDTYSQLSPSHFPILVVDDYPKMATMIRRMPLQLGFANSYEAHDGSDALEMRHRGHYHLVISDRHMQRMDGMALLGEIRAAPMLKDMPFIMVTGANDLDQVMEAKRAGVTDYIVKPFTMATPKEKLSHTLGRPRPAKDLRAQ
jgi:two-component system chemotaxis response regulator CheY